MNKNTVVFTGGGTAGHSLPNFPIISKLLGDNVNVIYIGSRDGVEKTLVKNEFAEKVKYFGIRCDKLRRYLTYRHIFVPFNVFFGIFEAYSILRQNQADCVFSKGGFVSVPVVIAARLLRLPIAIHESDFSMGLANKICCIFATKIFLSFGRQNNKVKGRRVECIPPLIDEEKILQILPMPHKFENQEKKIVLFFGGSLGAKVINNFIFNNMEILTQKYNIIHVCGHGNSNNRINSASYKIFEYLDHDNMIAAMKSADFIISRAGINSIFEILFLKKFCVLVPLPIECSRGDQIENAQYFFEKGLVMIIEENDLLFNKLSIALDTFDKQADEYHRRISLFYIKSGINNVYNYIKKLLM